ncbi:MAG: flavodoxin domain-containing protein [Acidimicrobiia bacterium]|nr:flavodoxin domain-containing protein [Acidimicrobiia bacterium]
MNAVILYETARGRTKTAAEHIASAMKAADVDVTVRPVDEVDLNELSAADLVIVGTWVHGLVVVGVGPAGTGKIGALPVIDGKPAAVFCTYKFNPRATLEKLASVVEDRGGVVIDGIALQQDHLREGVGDFVADLLVAVPA